MKEFMLFIHATGNPIGNLSEEMQHAHIQKVGGYIQDMVTQGKMKNAQPLIPSGINVSKADGDFTESPINEAAEMMVGFYHIQADSMSQALSIAKSDPRFGDGTWRMEVREIMNVEGIN